MKNGRKTKEKLIQELDQARKRIAELEAAADGHVQAGTAPQKSEEYQGTKMDTPGLPDVNIDSLELSDIIDLPYIRSLLDDFYKLTNMVLAFLDLKGTVLIAIGWQDICTKFHRVHPQTAINCTASDLYMAKNVKQGEYVAYKCKNQLWDMFTPLYIGGKHAGNIYTGQFFFDDETVDEEAFIRQADMYGFDRESYLAALRRVPRFSREKVYDIMNFVSKFSVLISELSFSNMELIRMMSEQRRTTEALRASEAKYRLLHNSMRDAFVSVDMKGHFKDYNESYLNMLGYSSEELSNLTYQDITPEKWHAVEADIITQQVLTRGYSDIFEKEYRRKDGTIFPVELRIVILKDNEGKSTVMWSIVRDITKRKRADEALQKRNEELERFEKLVVGRELKMVELKKRISQLEEALATRKENRHES